MNQNALVQEYDPFSNGLGYAKYDHYNQNSTTNNHQSEYEDTVFDIRSQPLGRGS